MEPKAPKCKIPRLPQQQEAVSDSGLLRLA